MSWSKLTLIGMNNYIDSIGGDLFALLSLPEGIEKDILCNTILSRGGEFEVIYSDPEFMASQIGYWSRRCYRTFDKWITALNIEYDPLYNYDRYEEWSDNKSLDKNFSGSILQVGGATDTNNLLQSTNTDIESVVKRSAMDSDEYQPKTKESMTGDADTNTISNTGTVTRSENNTTGTTNQEGVTEDASHSGHLYGNIGVTTSQQMLQSELDIAKWNIYEKITDLFLQEFVIPIFE